MNLRTYCALRKEASLLGNIADGTKKGVKAVRRWGEDLVDAGKGLFRKGKKNVVRGVEDAVTAGTRGAEDLYKQVQRALESGADEGMIKNMFRKAGYSWDDFATWAKRGAQDLGKGAKRTYEDVADAAKDGARNIGKKTKRGVEDARDYGKAWWRDHGDTVKSAGKYAGVGLTGAGVGYGVEELTDED